jgi:two-component system response regulator YesN
MPGLNGLDLIDKVKNILPNTVFIIISGYTEFDYAKKGTQIRSSRLFNEAN